MNEEKSGPNIAINRPFVTYIGESLIAIVTAKYVSFYSKIENNYTLSAMKAKLGDVVLQPKILQLCETCQYDEIVLMNLFQMLDYYYSETQNLAGAEMLFSRTKSAKNNIELK